MDLSAAELAGQALVVGFEGTDLPAWVRDGLSAGRLGGVIAFRRNLPDLARAHALGVAVTAAAPGDLPPFIGVDEEGGRVRRMPAPFPTVTAMRAYGDRDDDEATFVLGRTLGQALARFGFNLDFAPVLDVDTNPDNPIIGDRAFSRDPAVVARHGIALSRGFAASGVVACGKHFPGHGDTETDSHLELPRVHHDLERLGEVELTPFAAAVEAGLPALMSAHVVYRALDADVPATLSRRIATTLLREQLHFDGVLFSDDLEMKALADHFSVEDSAVRAISAGCDVLLVCSRRDFVERAHKALTLEAEKDEAFRERLAVSVARALKLRRSCPPRPDPSVPQSFEEFERALAAP